METEAEAAGDRDSEDGNGPPETEEASDMSDIFSFSGEI